MGTKHENMIELVERLKRRPMTQKDIASYFDKDARTVMRYIKELQVQQPLLQVSALNGRTKSYFIQSEETYDPKEIEELKKVIRDLGEAGNHKHARMIKNILHKIEPTSEQEQSLPTLQTLDKDYYIDNGPLAEHQSNTTQSQKLLYYIQEQMLIKITYKRRDDDVHSPSESFHFEPHKLTLRVGRLYLIGYNEGEEQARQIPVSQIRRINVTGKHFVPKELNIEDFYRYSFGRWISDAQPEIVEILIHENWIYNLFLNSYFVPPVKLTEGTRKVAQLKIRITPDFKSWLFGMMPEIEILKPLSLKKELLKKAQSIRWIFVSACT